MSNDYKSSKFKELLEKLQQESWQLELIISGFAIFGLASIFPELKSSLNIINEGDSKFYTPIVFLGLSACSILLFNLIIHVILRGLWIGALGLRYVSGDIDFDQLNYSKKFTKHLKKKIVSFDRYVATLENYCSILFAVSFLLIFYVVSITAVIFSLFLVATFIISNESINPTLRQAIGIPLALFIIFGSVLVMIDFFTQGFLKRKKWLSKIYFPFYWLFSFIGLTFLYRPLVYNFLDNKFTKRLSFLLVPAYILILVLISFKYKSSNYIDNIEYSSSIYLDDREYEDQLVKKDELVKRASIQSKVITDPYIKLFRVFNENIEGRVYRYNPKLKPKEDKRGFKTDIIIFSNDNNISHRKRDSLSREYIKTFNKAHKVFIDTVEYKSDFLLSKNPKKQIGFETFIPTKKLTEGRHLLQVKRFFKNRKGETGYTNDVTIPFWYYKN